MTTRQTKYLLAFLGLTAAVFAYTILGEAAGQNRFVSPDPVSAFFSIIVISFLLTAQSKESFRHDLKLIICALAGLVVYTVAKSVFITPSGLAEYMALLLGAMAAAVLHFPIHAISQNQSP